MTGSTGFIGSTLVKQLLDAGNEVVALARTQSKADRYVDRRATVLIGDVTDVSAIEPHLSDVDTFYHLAAYFKEYTGSASDDEEVLQRVNVDAVISLLTACQTAGVQTFVHTSTIGVLCPKSGVNDEASPSNDTSTNRYFQSKIRAEHAIRAWRDAHAKPSVRMVLPAAVCGPGDMGPTPLGRTVLEVMRGALPVCPPGAVNLVDVRDVAAVMMAAAERGVDGERYIACAGYRTMASMLREVAVAAKVRAPGLKIPYAMAMVYAGAAELGAKIKGVPPLATRVMINTLVDVVELDGSKATRELGVQYRDLESSWRDEVVWFRDNNLV